MEDLAKLVKHSLVEMRYAVGMKRAPLLRFRIRTLLIAVGVIALGCWGIPPWWRWHHEMLKSSDRYLKSAQASERGAAGERAKVATIVKGIESGTWLPGQVRSGHSAIRMIEKSASLFEVRADEAYRAATFPWLGMPRYEPKTNLDGKPLLTVPALADGQEAVRAVSSRKAH